LIKRTTAKPFKEYTFIRPYDLAKVKLFFA